MGSAFAGAGSGAMVAGEKVKAWSGVGSLADATEVLSERAGAGVGVGVGRATVLLARSEAAGEAGAAWVDAGCERG
jgi:hypothetical protein